MGDDYIEDLKKQFARCDISSNGWVSGQELTALAFSHGEQLQLQSVAGTDAGVLSLGVFFWLLVWFG